MLMHAAFDAQPTAAIAELAEEIIEECPSCPDKASEIVMWAEQIRERRPKPGGAGRTG